MTNRLSAFWLLILTATPVAAHRLDEYLQGTILAVTKNRVDVEMTLTPGVAVFPIVIAGIDKDGDGVITEAERQDYARQVLRDLTLAIDGRALTPHLTLVQFPPSGEMQEGRGEIRIDFQADLPRGAANRKLIIENHHQTRISVYQVNVLVPRDPAIRFVSQMRNYSQSSYELNFSQSRAESGPPVLSLIENALGLTTTLGVVAAAGNARSSVER